MALVEKLALETHESWRTNCLMPPTADSHFNYVKDYDDRAYKDYYHLPESEKEKYVAAATEAIREQMGWKSENRD